MDTNNHDHGLNGGHLDVELDKAKARRHVNGLPSLDEKALSADSYDLSAVIKCDGSVLDAVKGTVKGNDRVLILGEEAGLDTGESDRCRKENKEAHGERGCGCDEHAEDLGLAVVGSG